jgi:hypothetical protein
MPPPDGSVWEVASEDVHLEGQEAVVRLPNGSTRRYLIEAVEPLAGGMVALTLRAAANA